MRMSFAVYKSSVVPEMPPLDEGCEVTLEYELRYAEHPKTLAPDSVLAQQVDWTARLRGFLDIDDVLPDGGLLCFGLRHSYSAPTDDEYDPFKFEPKALETELRGMDFQLFRVLHNMGLKPALQLSYDGVFEEGVDVELSLPCPTRGLTGRPVNLLDISGSSKRTLGDVLKSEGTLAREGLNVDQVVWVTPATESTYTRQIYASKEEDITWVSYVRANVCIVARVKPHRDRHVTVVKKRKRKRVSVAEDVDRLSSPAKRTRRVHFNEEVREVTVERYNHCEWSSS